MTAAEALHTLVPGYACRGNIDDSTQKQYDELVWNDARPKPKWAEVQAAMLLSKPAPEKTLEERVAALEAKTSGLG